MPDKLKIKQFLDEMKASGSAFGFVFVSRDKNHETYLELELTATMREQVLKICRLKIIAKARRTTQNLEQILCGYLAKN